MIVDFLSINLTHDSLDEIFLHDYIQMNGIGTCMKYFCKCVTKIKTMHLQSRYHNSHVFIYLITFMCIVVYMTFI